MKHKIPVRGRPKDPAKAKVILEAASCLFLSKGLNATSMNAVAEKAGVSKQTLYSHFKGKDDLYSAVITEKVSSYEFKDKPFDFTGDLEDDLYMIAMHFLNLILDTDVIDMFRVVIGEGRTHKKIAKLFYESGPDKVFSNIAKYFESRGIPEPKLNAVLFTSMLNNEWHMKSLVGILKKPKQSEIDSYAKKVVNKFSVLIDSY